MKPTRNETAQPKRKIGVCFRHQTVDGPIELLSAEGEDGWWFGRLEGPQIAGMRRFKTRRGASNYVWRTFAEMFPEHRQCTKRCGPTEGPKLEGAVARLLWPENPRKPARRQAVHATAAP